MSAIRDGWQHALVIIWALAAGIAYGSENYPAAAWFAFVCIVSLLYALADDLLDEIRQPRALPTCSKTHPRYGHACHPMRAPICPECAQLKHRNCTGWALDETTDQITTCACEQARHEENR